MEKIIVSACLLGDNTKYNGGNNLNEELVEFLKDYEVIKICPEVMGGLSTPRVPSERVNNKVLNKENIDVTNEYIKGANIALKMALDNDIKIAILKYKSPSCGVGKIYDGTFSSNLIDGDGVTVELFKKHGITCLTELNYKEYFRK